MDVHERASFHPLDHNNTRLCIHIWHSHFEWPCLILLSVALFLNQTEKHLHNIGWNAKYAVMQAWSFKLVALLYIFFLSGHHFPLYFPSTKGLCQYTTLAWYKYHLDKQNHVGSRLSNSRPFVYNFLPDTRWHPNLWMTFHFVGIYSRNRRWSKSWWNLKTTAE